MWQQWVWQVRLGAAVGVAGEVGGSSGKTYVPFHYTCPLGPMAPVHRGDPHTV